MTMHTDPIAISEGDLARWLEIAGRAFELAPAPAFELQDARRDPTPWRLGRAARAARYAATLAPEHQAAELAELAAELEGRADAIQ